ncbi:MAG TPA: protein-methionine-sulfoxide reductase catalytic subunit MsrP [Thermoanaerobaculia bacterium]|nr:protein-methionine-sulfoxide reductase catalytic subunit MsrP [Thermoanaerobaculia bacterium]
MAHLRIPRPWELPERLATPESVFLDRRQALAALGLGAAALALPQLACSGGAKAPTGADAKGLLDPAIGSFDAGLFRAARRNPAYGVGDRPLTPENVAAAYNNFYEWTTDKPEVWRLAHGYPAAPWKLEIAGLVEKPATLDLDQILKVAPLEERLYRHRCVERWAMQVLWVGYPLRRLIERARPLSSARFVRFVSIDDPARMPGQKESSWLSWPYYEALRMDEAMNDLAFAVVGSYGHALPMQHGAPLRIAAPWKYGYKSPKSIVRIELVAEQPGTFWNYTQPNEYGLVSNVNPDKPHPRWSQAYEQDIGTGERRRTLLYNGYAAQVAGMYDGQEV